MAAPALAINYRERQLGNVAAARSALRGERTPEPPPTDSDPTPPLDLPYRADIDA